MKLLPTRIVPVKVIGKTETKGWFGRTKYQMALEMVNHSFKNGGTIFDTFVNFATYSRFNIGDIVDSHWTSFDGGKTWDLGCYD